MSRKRAMLVSFSGVDGSGKSTQIESLSRAIAEAGLSSRTYAFWDDVVVLSRYREQFVHKVYKSERGIGAPGKPVNRRDKNVRAWHLTIGRHVLYFLDAVNLRRVVKKVVHTGEDVIILDRYIYDQMANLPLSSPLTRGYLRMVKAIVPRPDVAFFLDADPEAAYARKPEYPLDFMHRCRLAYHTLAAMLGNMTVVPPLPLDRAKKTVVDAFWTLAREKFPFAAGSNVPHPQEVLQEVSHLELRHKVDAAPAT